MFTWKCLFQAMYRHRVSEEWTAPLKLGSWLQVHSLYSSGSQPESEIFGNVWGNSAPPESFGDVWKCFWLPWPGILLTPGRERPGMLLNPLQMHRTAPNNEELSGSKCQQCQVWETLFCNTGAGTLRVTFFEPLNNKAGRHASLPGNWKTHLYGRPSISSAPLYCRVQPVAAFAVLQYLLLKKICKLTDLCMQFISAPFKGQLYW